MEKLLPANKWIAETFESGITIDRVNRWVKQHIIPGVIIDGKTFVYPNRAGIMLESFNELNANAIDSTLPAPPNNVAQLVNNGLYK